MTRESPFTHPLRLADLSGRKPTRFTLAPDAAARAAIGADLGLTDLPALRFSGELAPRGRRDWQLAARLQAEVVQPCVATLAPVHSVIDEAVERLYVADLTEPEGDEVEMPDDRIEPLPAVLDLAEVMVEALALALPLYPRAAEAGAGDAQAAAPGVTPLRDEDLRPLAGLKDLLRARGGAAEDSD